MKKVVFNAHGHMANELYGIDGMPEPDVQVNIVDFADLKMNYLMAW